MEKATTGTVTVRENVSCRFKYENMNVCSTVQTTK